MSRPRDVERPARQRSSCGGRGVQLHAHALDLELMPVQLLPQVIEVANKILVVLTAALSAE
jgi:hypothetical protein